MTVSPSALRSLFGIGLLIVASCAAAARPTTGKDSAKPPATDGAGDDDGTAVDVDGTTPEPTSPPLPSGADPFAPQVDESAGLTNVSKSLNALLEKGALATACDDYRAGATDRKTKLLCGKWMFFYESFGTVGVPAPLVKFLAKSFPDELGLGFSKLGMIPDPTSADHLPLGMALSTTPISDSIDSYAYTCASCHFGKLPDGRYAVGAPNHDYDYAGQILTIAIAPSLGLGVGSASAHDPDAVARVQPVLDKLKSSLALKAQFGLALAPLLKLQKPGISKEIEAQYAAWPVGTQDFMIAPLPVDDGVDIVGKMIGLWNIPRDGEVSKNEMQNAMLGWAGAAHSLHDFLGGFSVVGGAAPGEIDIEPLAEYIYSLRAPANPTPPDPDLVTTGAALFEAKGCIGCHDGPRGSGMRPYTFDEIGTDDTLARWLDPDLTGNACCSVDLKAAQLTHGVKSPRLVGMWALKRFLHNGSLSSLDQLFCLAPRPAGEKPLATTGHMFTCDALEDTEKRALMAYVLAH